MEEVSLTVQLDNLIRCNDLYLNNSCEKELLRYVKDYECLRRQNLNLMEECKCLKTAVDKAANDISSLQLKLTSARSLVDGKQKSINLLKKERDVFRKQIEKVKQCLNNNGDAYLPDNIKKDIAFLYEDYRVAAAASIRLNYESNFSDISYSLSEDDLNEVSRRSRTFRKYVPSSVVAIPLVTTPVICNQSFKRSIEDTSDKAVKKLCGTDYDNQYRQIDDNQIPVQSDLGFPLSSTTIVVVEKSKVLSDNNKICSSSAFESSASVKENLRGDINDKNQMLAKFEDVLRYVCNREHFFVSKNVYMAEVCNFCDKRIIFGKKAFKCTDCNAFAHFECKVKIPLPRSPIGSNVAAAALCKGRGGTLIGYLHDYTSLISPMVPALVVHCICEIERRGMSEIGLYRVCGSDKDVRALKGKFLRSKGIVPDLSKYDVACVCGCLKSFFRTLQDTLIPKYLYDHLYEVINNKSSNNNRTVMLTETVDNLPQPNRDTLAFLILHLQRVATTNACKMPVPSLAKIFAPTVIGDRQQVSTSNEQALNMVQTTISIMEELLNLPSAYWMSFIVKDYTYEIINRSR